jgi:hypothetical protein
MLGRRGACLAVRTPADFSLPVDGRSRSVQLLRFQLRQLTGFCLLEKTAAKIARTQWRNALAREGHTRRTRERLRELGIKLTDLPRCDSGPT